MTLVQKMNALKLRFEEFVPKFVRMSFYVLGAIALLAGGLMTGGALDGAGVIPNYFLRHGYSYTTYQAVTLLLFGEAWIFAGVTMFFIARDVR